MAPKKRTPADKPGKPVLGDNDKTTKFVPEAKKPPAAALDPNKTMAVTESMILPLGAPRVPQDATMQLTPDMVLGDATLMASPAVLERAIRVVERWHAAVNAKNADGVVATCADDIELAGPRGAGRGHAAIREWLGRAGFSAKPKRWFCGGNGHVVVEQEAKWRERDGAGSGVIASAFVVRDDRITRYEVRPTHDARGPALVSRRPLRADHPR
jgi:hypothetical protein